MSDADAANIHAQHYKEVKGYRETIADLHEQIDRLKQISGYWAAEASSKDKRIAELEASIKYCGGSCSVDQEAIRRRKGQQL